MKRVVVVNGLHYKFALVVVVVVVDIARMRMRVRILCEANPNRGRRMTVVVITRHNEPSGPASLTFSHESFDTHTNRADKLTVR